MKSKDLKIKEVLYIDNGENKVDDIERMIIHIENGGEVYRVLASIFEDGGVVVPDRTPDCHMVPIEDDLRRISLEAAAKACCKIGIYVDPIATHRRMRERDEAIHGTE